VKRVLALIPVAMMLIAASASPHKVVRTIPALDFTFEWPAEAAAIPALDLQLYTEAKRDLAEALRNALEDQTLARQQKRDFNQHDFSMKWSVAGQSARLLSLQNELGSFEGGAHPNSNYGALLWDRDQNREVALPSLFAAATQFAALTRATYCKKLDLERAKRREGDKLGGDFDKCPKYSELAVSLADRNRNGRFDQISFVASPYVAGPYVEGAYEITLPVTSAIIAALKPEYRASFEVHRQ
jgi:hypothetical protein